MIYQKLRGPGPHCLPLGLRNWLTKESGPGPLSKPYYSVQSQGLLQRKVNTHMAVSRETGGSKRVNKIQITSIPPVDRPASRIHPKQCHPAQDQCSTVLLIVDSNISFAINLFKWPKINVNFCRNPKLD